MRPEMRGVSGHFSLLDVIFVKNTKTNAMRMLDTLQIPYRTLSYTLPDDVPFSGEAVAEVLGADADTCFKSLCAHGGDGQCFLFVIPVAETLDLKKAAKAAGQKRVELLPTKDLKSVTGYMRGSVSPVGLKRAFPVFIDETATLFPEIAVSGGAQGVSLALSPQDLQRAVNACFTDLV